MEKRTFQSSLIAFFLFFLVTGNVQYSFARQNDIQVSVCTQDMDQAAPLEGAVVVLQLGNQQPAGGTTGSNGCVDITIEVATSTSVEDIDIVPSSFAVQAPFPNPFGDEVYLPLTIEQTQQVALEVYDITGRSVLPRYESVLAAGNHRFTVALNHLKPGMYLYQFTGEYGSATGKLVKVGSGNGTKPTVRVGGGESTTFAERPAVRSSVAQPSEFAVRIDAMRQGYLAARSEIEVTDGEQVVLVMEKVAPGVPSAPIVSLPGNGSVGVQLENAELEWVGDDLATSYAVQVSTTADFSRVDIQQEGWPLESFTLPLLEPATLYYWRVRATGDEGTSEWSLVFQFTTVDDTQTPPDAPLLSSPANGAMDLSPTGVQLEWVSVLEAVNYRVQMATDDAFNNLIVDIDGVQANTYTSVELFDGISYYWRVRANGDGGVSDWSEVYGFSTTPVEGPPEPPVLTAPGDGNTNITPGITTIRWEASVGATNYDFQMSTVPTFSTLVDEQAGVTGTSLSSIELAPEITYYWHVRASNSNGTSDWSAVYSFTTTSGETGGGVPDIPELVSPADGVTGISPTGVNLTWNSAVDAEEYDVQLSTNTNFSTLVGEQTSVQGLSALFNDLAPNVTYYWRVLARNQEGTSDWSAVSSFTTGQEGSANEMIALDLMGPNDTYYGLPGGLVDNGVPTVTPTNNKIIIIAISMSNGFQEFNRFIELYRNHPDVENQIELVNCAVGGSALERWLTENTLWSRCKDKIDDLSAVKVVWAKNANQFTEHGRTLPDEQADYYDLVDNIGALSQRISEEFPSVQAVFHSSRIWGGYVSENKQAARGEPISYEGGYAINTVIEQYKAGELTGTPWIGWGPYIWANGLTPNASGIFWDLSDFQDGGVNQHPSINGATKVADALHEFFMQFDWYAN